MNNIIDRLGWGIVYAWVTIMALAICLLPMIPVLIASAILDDKLQSTHLPQPWPAIVLHASTVAGLILHSAFLWWLYT